MSEKAAEQLADKVANAVISAGVEREILQALFNAVKNNTRESVLDALLIYGGNKISERDREWVRHLAGIYAPRSGEQMANSPAEVLVEINKWVAAREKDIRLEERRKGFVAGFENAVERATRFGWGGCEAGKGLDDVLAMALTKLKP